MLPLEIIHEIFLYCDDNTIEKLNIINDDCVSFWNERMKMNFLEWRDIINIKTKNDYFQVKEVYDLSEKGIIEEIFSWYKKCSDEDIENYEEWDLYYFDIQSVIKIFGKRFRKCVALQIEKCHLYEDTYNKILDKLISVYTTFTANDDFRYVEMICGNLMNRYVENSVFQLEKFK